MKEEGKSFFQKATDDYYVNFENDTLYTLRLDINDAFGKYKINKQGEIEISPGMMTLVCCDSEFADKEINCFLRVKESWFLNPHLIQAGISLVRILINIFSNHIPYDLIL